MEGKVPVVKTHRFFDSLVTSSLHCQTPTHQKGLTTTMITITISAIVGTSFIRR